MVFELEKEATVEEINAAIKKAAEGPMKTLQAHGEIPSSLQTLSPIPTLLSSTHPLPWPTENS